jgi:glycosyltransferase involved in cell wall biosynthesis
MHIAMILCNPFHPDPRALKEAEGLAERGHQITLICWDRAAEMKPEETLASGVRVLRVQTVASGYGVGARQLLRFPRFWRAAFSLLSRLQPDIVHCHGFDALPPGLLWGKLRRRPVVLDAYEYYAELVKPRLHGPGGTLLYQLIRQAEIVVARLASAVVTVDDTLGAIYRRANRRVVIIGHYPRRALAAEAAPVFTRPDLTLLYIGRLSVDRGILVYADVLRRLREQGVPARLRLVGVFTPASEERPLRERLRGLEEAVDIVPWVPYDQIAAVLHGADVGLVLLQPEPRYVAALPVKLFEYMAAGLPVVANDYPLVATRCGALVDPTDPQAAAEIIRHWWQHPAEARAAGESGRQAILDKYNWEAIMERLVELYDSLAKRSG